ncbi:hypothetical protein [Nesterenkonia sp. K-15-9-6]|uniref:hypothetical protein n=1 Tax=Nesterenkonia sp. K-15-9-6 TaxID=3093918 RepID=UPI004044CD16
MISLFRQNSEAAWEYREAWYDEAAGEFVVHYGAVGANGKLTAEKAQADEAEALLEGFAAQCEADGYREIGQLQTVELVVAVPLKASEPSASERRNAETVHTAVLTGLAWRGLGALSDPEIEEHDDGAALVMRARTVHRRKAGEAVRGALRATDVPASKVRIRVG